MNRTAKTKAVLFLCVSAVMLLAGCEAETPHGNYKIYVTDGWRQNTLYCDSYERNGYDVKCISDGVVSGELILNSDFDITITKIER